MADGNPSQPNGLSQAGAEILAARIKEYWVSQGYPKVETRIEPFNFGPHLIFSVRSNMVGGVPPRC
ncbi:hypothetical protein TSA6c_16805 [Azospirillum sp. TSA6c]|uniref:hypothetical protein n=1 Tax=Azospirillum sp. TSA6c TaxID=709813 RepID=UPI000D608DC1|nr:hypothetical protein [Azospirillum sp. TSA6c]PWC48100.1 hypothetical protein TSA6c_16805 [Azospirillum sp. TSA6c]